MPFAEEDRIQSVIYVAPLDSKTLGFAGGA